MAQIRSSQWWASTTALVATAFVGSLAAMTAWQWPGEPAAPYVAPARPTVSDSASAAAPVDHPAPLPALPLTEGVLQGVDAEWVLFEYDSSAVSGPATPSPSASAPVAVPTTAPTPDIIGPRYLYLADRTGQLYQAADLGEGSPLRLLTWLPDRRTALVTGPTTESLDGASPGPAAASDGSVAVRTFDLVTGELGDPFPAPPGRSTAGWTAPRVAVTRAGDGLLISEGPAASRQLVRSSFDGASLDVAAPATDRGAFVEGDQPGVYVSRELETLETVEVRGDDIVDVKRLTWRIVSYAPPAPEPAPTASPSASAAPAPTPAGEPAPYERTEHFLPGGEERCTPARWPAERQLLILCDGGEGTATVYTLALGTSTTVLATTLRWDGQELLTMSPDGTRVFVGETMYDLFAEPRWSVDLSTTDAPAQVTWAGDFAVLSGDADYPAVPATSLSVRDRTTGRVMYEVRAYPGAVGFGVVAPAT